MTGFRNDPAMELALALGRLDRFRDLESDEISAAREVRNERYGADSWNRRR